MKLYRILTFILVLFSLRNEVLGQQESVYSQYMFNRLVINPSYAGTKDGLSLTALYRHQFTGFTPFNGDPRQYAISGHSPVLDGRGGIGLYVIADWNGAIQRNSANAALAYRFQVGKTGALSFGINGGVQQFTFNNFVKNPYDKYDPAVPNGAQTVYNPDFGAGIFYNNGVFYAGVSGQHLFENEINILRDSDRDHAKYSRHFYFTAGYDIRVSNDFLISPSTFMRYVKNAPFQFDINCNFTFVDVFWIGATYRHTDAMAGLIGFNIAPKFRVGYSYDYHFFGLNRFNTGSHEVMLNWDLGNVTRTRLQIPRYF